MPLCVLVVLLNACAEAAEWYQVYDDSDDVYIHSGPLLHCALEEHRGSDQIVLLANSARTGSIHKCLDHNRGQGMGSTL